MTLKTLWIFTKNVLQNHILFLVSDATLASDNPLGFRKNILEKIQKLIMTTDNKLEIENCNMILTEKQQKYRIINWKN